MARRGVALWVALVEQRRNLVGIEFRVLLLRWFLRLQRSRLVLRLRLRLVLLLDFFSNRVGLAWLRLGRRRLFLGSLDFFFLGDLCLGIFNRLRRLLPLFLYQRLRRLDFLGVLRAFGDLGEVLITHQVNGQGFRRRDIECLAGKRQRRPQQHSRMQASRDRCSLSHHCAFAPCSNSVTKATR